MFFIWYQINLDQTLILLIEIPNKILSNHILFDCFVSQAQLKDDTLKEIKNVEQLAAALPNLIKPTPAPPKEAVPVEEKADIRKEPPVPEAPEVKVISEASPVEAKKEDVKEVKLEEAKIPAPEVAKEKQISDKKDDVINHDAIKKEDDEIKEVQKQEILKKKDQLIEKLEENEQKQQLLLEEQKKLLQDIKVEKEKLIEENKQLKKEEIFVNKNKNDDISNLQNEIVDKPKEVLKEVNLPKKDLELRKNNQAIEEKFVMRKVEEQDNSVNNIIKEDIVKRNMADGVPIPIAIQNVMPRIVGVKSVKIVDNVDNPNEGKADSKVLRREILEKDEVKEQREKRDVEEVESLDLKENKESLNKEIPIKSEIQTVQDEKAIGVGTNIVVKKSLEKSVLDAQLIDLTLTSQDIKTSLLTKDLPLKLETNETEQCDDKSKSKLNKFSDDLKPVNNEEAVGKKIEEKVQKKVASDLGINGETKEELDSLIKSPAYLSDPKIILPAEEVLENNMEESILLTVAKSMRRDLKSISTNEKGTSKEK